MILFQNIDVYAPEYLGRKDVLTVYDKIVKIADAGTITADGLLSGAETVDGTGLVLTPGFVDCHVHVLGGGGEGGFANRTPEATMEGLNKFGVTTVVGCLGTDGIGRDMCALVAKTKGLREQGMSAWCYTGSYQVPVRTLTDGITKDIMMIEEIIGTGEIAISDHRSSQPTFEEFARLAADTRLGGVLSGKAGVINVHLGNGARCMELIERVISETEIPASQFLPTHVNRNEKLFQKAIEYAVKGGAVDFTGNEEIDYWETVCDEVGYFFASSVRNPTATSSVAFGFAVSISPAIRIMSGPISSIACSSLSFSFPYLLLCRSARTTAFTDFLIL